VVITGLFCPNASFRERDKQEEDTVAVDVQSSD